MSAVVFLGPTLGVEAARGVLEADYRPPVMQGDVYRAARQRPRAIGIVDGYFDGVPSVWHKEILWAMEQGIAVFGSASMGALRAAELVDFGMIGVGAIYQDYRTGVLQDDDEVAVLHGPAELGFAALSEPMVSVRATIARARTEGILGETSADRMLVTAKATHYRDRTWGALQEAMTDLPELDRFRDWLDMGRVDAKRDDACEMLKRIGVFLNRDDGVQAPHRVERTLVWQNLTHRIETEVCATPESGVLNELRLSPDLYDALRNRAALRLLAIEWSGQRASDPDLATLRARLAQHRADEGLSRKADILRWLADNELDESGYEDLLATTVHVEQILAIHADRLEPHLLAELRLSGHYPRLRARAAAKAQQLNGTTTPVPEKKAQDRLGLLIWYFETLLDRDVPKDLDAYAEALGLSDGEKFVDLIAHEFLYSQEDGGAGVGGA